MVKSNSETIISEIHKARNEILNELSKCIIGQKSILDLLLIALLAGGHCILHGVPGLAKTLIVQSLAKVLNLTFSRIQFTPDLMPSDITGTEVIEESKDGRKGFNFFKGPIFANIVLADEINRTPPKTQAALLQAMQEKSITLYGKTYYLDLPFFVLATENPIEQEGTYMLPEAQLDRFLFNIDLDYPDFKDEVQIASKKTYFNDQTLKKVIDAKELIMYQDFIENIPISDKIIEYVVTIVKNTRPQSNSSSYINDNVAYGAGPRASQNIVIAAKAHAALTGNYSVTKDNIKQITYPILKHRIILNFSAVSSRISTKDIIDHAVEIADK
ncbi:MAG: MoxR family ATPase [Spirochaetota bacterium]|nr:MoxR family ATPase [Spirochaetota bacterium]